jgi:hypothetical protein
MHICIYRYICTYTYIYVQVKELESQKVDVEKQLNDTVLCLKEAEESVAIFHDNFNALQEKYDILYGSNNSLIATQTMEVDIHEKTVLELNRLIDEYDHFKAVTKNLEYAKQSHYISLEEKYEYMCSVVSAERTECVVRIQVYMYIYIYIYKNTLIYCFSGTI